MKRWADSHIHIRFTQSDKIEAMLDDLASLGVTDACLLPLPYRGAAENLAALYWKMRYTKMNVRAFGGLHLTDRYGAIPCEVQAKALWDMGCDGFKFMYAPEFPMFFRHRINGKHYEKLFDFLEERDVPVNIHLADPETFWNEGQQYEDPKFPSKREMFEETFDLLDKHPNLRVTFAHFMFLSDEPDEAVRVMETYPNVRFDLTPGVEMYENFDKRIAFWHDFFTRYSNRILFGTDSNTIKTCNKNLEMLVLKKLTHSHDFFTERCYKRDFTVRGLALSEEVTERICYQNYIDFVREKKPVNKKMFSDCCRRILRDLQEEPYDPYYIAGGLLIPDLQKDPDQDFARQFCEEALKEAELWN